MKAVLIDKNEITAYIPQKPPMVMVHTLEHCDGLAAETGFLIEPGNIFVQDGVLREPGIIENIAQTAALKAGYEYKKRGLEPPLGFIGAVKGLKIYSLPKVNSWLTTQVIIKTEIMGVTLVAGVSSCEGLKVSECEMKIFLQKPEELRA